MKRLIRLPEVRSMTGLGRSEIYRLEALGRFPKRVPIGERATAWDSEEIEVWVAERIAARDQAAKQRSAVGRRLARARAQLQAA